MNEVIKILLELRDKLYENDLITIKGVWMLNRTISQIQGKCGISDSEIGYAAPEVSTYFPEENSCKFHHYINCEKCDNCEKCGWNPKNEYLRSQRVKRETERFYEASLTKTYSSMNEAMDEMILWPGIKFSYYGPSYKQMAKIASQTYRQIQKDCPGIAKHFTVDADAADRFQISTAFGSRLAITAFRGDNVHAVIAEEYAQEKDPPFDTEEYRRVVLPSVRLAYKTRGKKDKTYVPYKQHTITSAGRRQNHSFSMTETMRCLTNSSLLPHTRKATDCMRKNTGHNRSWKQHDIRSETNL